MMFNCQVIYLGTSITLLILWSCVTSLKIAPPLSQANQAATYPFQNTSLPWNVRVDDIVSRLTLDEMQLLMTTSDGSEPAIPRLGIQQYGFSSECLHGAADGNRENATVYPQSIGLAATFSPSLLYRVASAIGLEVRGKHNDYAKRGQFGPHTGASCFSPVINIARDPRWGRLQETYGEDPFLSGILAENYVKGLQGNHSRYVQATAGCKHFDAYAGPENIPVPRLSFNVVVSDLDWHTTFLPAFKRCVQAGTFSLMCSYNSINGVPACANKKLLTDILRNEWNFTGYVVSDMGALENIISSHHYVNNTVDAAAAAVNAGTNLNLPSPSKTQVFMSIVDAVKQGKLSEALVRERVKPLFYTRMRLGEFDPPNNNPYANLNNSVVETPEHQALAIEAAIKSFVLLKNQNNILPLNPQSYHNVVIVGPMSDNAGQLSGDYSPSVDRSFIKTPLQGLKQIFPRIRTANGCVDGTPCKNYQSSAVQNTVAGADLIFVALGTGQAVEAEVRDRPDLSFPGNQSHLLTDVLTHSNTNNIILLLFNAGPLNLTLYDELPRIPAILELFFPAQATGDALVAVLTNKGGNSSPAGRLPVTWPKYASQIPPMVNYSMVGRTYRYMDSDPLYPFGYGLSYSQFKYNTLGVQYNKRPRENIHVTVNFTNVGDHNSDEVIQCYIVWGNKSLPVPRIQLVYFNRINVNPGQQIIHHFQVDWENWAYWDNTKWTVQSGVIILYCGGQQPFQKRNVPSNIINIDVPVFGDQDNLQRNQHETIYIEKSAVTE